MGRNDLEDIAILVGLGIVGVMAYQKFFPGKSPEEILKELDTGMRAFLDSIKLPTLPEIQFPVAQPLQPATADSPITPTEPAAEPTNTADTDSDTRPKVNDPPKNVKPPPEESGQVPNNPTVPAPPPGSLGAIVAFAGDFDNTNGTKATMQSMDKHNVSFIVGAGDYAYSGSAASWYNSVIAGTRFKGKMHGAHGNHDTDSQYPSLFGQTGWVFTKLVAPNLAVVFIDASKGIAEATLTSLTKSGKSQAKHVAYVMHEPYITSDNGHHGPGENKSAAVIDKVAKAFGVKLIVSGHNHLYEHFLCNGIHYVTSGAAGRKFYPGNCKNTCAPVKCVENTNGFLKVAVGNTLRCQFIANSGQELDTFDIV